MLLLSSTTIFVFLNYAYGIMALPIRTADNRNIHLLEKFRLSRVSAYHSLNLTAGTTVPGLFTRMTLFHDFHFNGKDVYEFR